MLGKLRSCLLKADKMEKVGNCDDEQEKGEEYILETEIIDSYTKKEISEYDKNNQSQENSLLGKKYD